MPTSRENRWSTQGRLCDNQRDIANRYLRALSPAQRQPILDELEGRFQAEQKGMKPVYDEISFLIRLCELTKSGEFLPNLGIKVREARRVREASRDRAALSRRTSSAEGDRRATAEAHGGGSGTRGRNAQGAGNAPQ